MTWQERLGDLRLLVPPPEAPAGAPFDWDRFAAENGFRPPADYRALLDTYGAGWFEAGIGGLVLEQPFHPARSFLEGNRWLRDVLLDLQRSTPGQVPQWPVYPAPGGYLPFAADESSWSIGWLTPGEPDGWTVAIDGGRDGWWAALPIGAVELVARWSAGDLGIPEVEPAPPGGQFTSQTADAYWSEATATANVEFGASPLGQSFPQWPIERVRALVAPGSLRSFGARGSAAQPIRANVSVAYRPAEEAQVRAALERLAVELGTTIAEARALDGSRIWTGTTDLRLLP